MPKPPVTPGRPVPVAWNRHPVASGRSPIAPPPRPTTFNFSGRHPFVASPRYSTAPIYVDRRTIINNVTYVREEPVVSGYRVGYVQYSPSFAPSGFSYPHYSYWPYTYTVSSPWYYYPQLPPYLPDGDAYVEETPAWPSDYETYDWSPPAPRRPWGALDYLLKDLVASFTDPDPDRFVGMTPSNGLVAIYLDGSYRYSVPARDYRLMMVDSMRHVRTSGFHVDHVRRFSGRRFQVYAHHNTVDAWGHRQTVYQTYRLVPHGRSYWIRDFGTSQRAP